MSDYKPQEKLWKFWYSKTQKKAAERRFGFDICFGRPATPIEIYAVIDGRLVEYTECCSQPESDYTPNVDDAVFLGLGKYACDNTNLQTYLRKHPEVQLGPELEWPDLLLEVWEQ
jgi:hypothetical protein